MPDTPYKRPERLKEIILSDVWVFWLIELFRRGQDDFPDIDMLRLLEGEQDRIGDDLRIQHSNPRRDLRLGSCDNTAESIDAYFMRRSPCSMSKGFCQRSICSRTNRRKV